MWVRGDSCIWLSRRTLGGVVARDCRISLHVSDIYHARDARGIVYSINDPSGLYSGCPSQPKPSAKDCKATMASPPPWSEKPRVLPIPFFSTSHNGHFIIHSILLLRSNLTSNQHQLSTNQQYFSLTANQH